jgi:hypothetical protein
LTYLHCVDLNVAVFLVSKRQLQFFLQLALLSLLLLNFFLQSLFVFGTSSSLLNLLFTFTLLIRVLTHSLVGTHSFLPLFLLLGKSNLLSDRGEAINRYLKLLMKLNFHLLAGSDPFLCLDHARVVISIRIGGEDSLAVPLLFLGGLSIIIEGIILLHQLVSFFSKLICQIQHFLLNFGVDLL